MLRNDNWPNPHLLVISGGILARILFWLILPPIWKLYASFSVFDLPLINYISDFQSYHPLRMPFFDIASAALFAPFEPLLGTNALTLFSLLISCIGLIGFNFGSRRLFSDRIAIFATLMFAFYPKLVVMSARGMPEAAAVSLLGLMLAPVGKGIDTNSTKEYVYAGIWAVLAYLMYMPAVLAGIVTTSYLYLRKVQKSHRSVWSLVPNIQVVSFAMPSFVVGIFGTSRTPLRELC